MEILKDFLLITVSSATLLTIFTTFLWKLVFKEKVKEITEKVQDDLDTIVAGIEVTESKREKERDEKDEKMINDLRDFTSRKIANNNVLISKDYFPFKDGVIMQTEFTGVKKTLAQIENKIDKIFGILSKNKDKNAKS